MLKNLQHIGERGKSFDWFKTYLTDRKQYVVSDGTFTTSEVVDSGIPQGSILGPLSSWLYLNDLSRSLEILNFVNFADDITVFLSHPNSDALYVSCKEELCKVRKWLVANVLSLNDTKSCHMIISNKKWRKKRLMFLEKK